MMEEDRRGPADLARAVIDDAKAAAAAEIGLVKAIAAHRASGLKLGVPLLLAALFVMQGLVTALLVGMIVSLSPLIGPGLATLATALAGAALVGVLAWAGLRRLRSLWEPLDEGKGR